MDWMGMLLVGLTAAFSFLAITSRPQIVVRIREPAWTRQLKRYLARVEDVITPRRYLALSIASAIVGLIFFRLMLGSRGVVGLLAGVAGPEAYVRYKRRERKRMVDNQVIGLIAALKRALQAGVPLVVALDRLAENQPEPIRGYLAFVRDLIYTGSSFPGAVDALREQTSSQRLWLVFKVLKVSESKGMSVQDLVDTLNRLAENMAANLRLRQLVRAQTAGTRASQWLVAGLVPFVLAMTLRVPTIYDFFIHDPVGRFALGLVFLLELASIFVGKEVIRLKGPLAA